jgi:2-keto-4-pentenoate hydratase/2-oxohepta-3-ene-1,7-dioic acid hydratase in catechol pathway
LSLETKKKRGVMKIFAVGMNYVEHNKELGNTLLITEKDLRKTEEPVIFTKPDSALLKDGKPFFIPDFMGRIDYETEVVVRICRLGKGIPQQFAHRYYDAVTLGIDFTAREVQKKAKDLGRPWTIAKGFDGSAVIGAWVKPTPAPSQREGSLKDVQIPIQDLHFRLDINGETRQVGYTGDMLYKVDELISYISKYFTLKTGDLLFTGTPVGVGPVHIDDHLEGWLEDRKVLEFNCK